MAREPLMWPDDTDLPVEVHAAFGADLDANPGDWEWTDLTDRMLNNPIPARWGSSGSSGQVQPSTATVHLTNDDGAFTPLYASSPYYPNVEVGTPVRVCLRRAEDSFARSASGGWGSADSGQSWTAGGGTGTDFSVTGGTGRHGHSTVNFTRRSVLATDLLDTEQIVDSSTSVLLTGAALVTGVLARYLHSGTYYWARTEFNSGGTSVMLKISRRQDDVETTLADLNPVPGVTYAANTPLRTRVSVSGATISMRVWPASGPEPTGWHLEYTDTEPLTAPGATGLQSWLVAGNSNALPVTASFANYSLRVDRVTGHADEWKPVFTPTTDGDVSSQIRLTAAGILRRLGQGASKTLSPATRYTAATAPIAYWPLEDGSDSTQAASGILDGRPMVTNRGLMDFDDDTPPGASGSAHPQPSAVNALIGTISGAGTTGFQASVWTKGELLSDDNSDPAAGAYYIPWEVRTSTGQIFRLVMQWDETVAIGVGLYSSEDQTTASQFLELESPTAGITGKWIHCHFLARQSGADIDVFLWVDGILVDSATWTGVTVGAPVRVNAIGAFAGSDPGGVSKNMRDIWLSQLAIHDFGSAQVPQHNAGRGFPGEPASNRIARVCAEEGIPLYLRGGGTEILGPQPVGTLLEVLRDAETADMGILSEHGFGLAYRPRRNLYNQDPRLTIDLDTYQHSQEIRADQVLAPTYDDQSARNDWTVSRRDGSSTRVVDAADIARRGTRNDEIELSLWQDSQLPHQAGWRLHLGTWREMRYPGIHVDLAGNPDLVDAWLNLRPGDRVQQIHVPAPHPPEDVDQLAGGFSETLMPKGWTGQAVGTPARPWTVGVIEDNALGRADTDGSKWVQAFDAGTDTSALVAVTGGPPWINSTDHSAMFPFAVRSSGVVLEVTGIANAIFDNFNRSVGAGGFGTTTTGQPWSVGAGTASEFSVNGSTGRMVLASVNDLHVATIDTGSPDHDPISRLALPVVPTGATITLRQYARWADASNHYFAELSIQTDAVPMLRLYRRVATVATAIGSTIRLTPQHTAGAAWWVQCSAIGSTIRARAWMAGQPEARGWHITATDTALTSATRAGPGARREASNSNGSQAIDVENFAAPALHVFTLGATPVNGVTRTIPAGTTLSLATPWRAAL